MLKMIIADDMEAICVQLCRCIESFDLDIQVCETFSNGQQVLEYLAVHDIDIVLTDIKMPVASGLEVAEYVYLHCPNTKVIIMSAYGDFEYAKRAIQFRVFDYLQKAIDLEELRSTLQKITAMIREERENRGDVLQEDEDKHGSFLAEILENNHIDGVQWNLMYPELDLKSIQIGYYRLKMKNYRQVMISRWKYESERLIDAIYGIVRMTLMEKRALGVEFLDYSEKEIVVSVISGKEFRLPVGTIKANLESFAGLIVDCVSVNVIAGDLGNEKADNTEKTVTLSMTEPENSEDSVKMIEQAMKYIRDNIGQAISRGDVAHFCGYSVSHFSRLFTSVTGVSISKYIFDVRMERVIQLLNTDMKIKEIAQKTGYHDTRQLRRNLEMYTGMTPVEYRKKILNRTDEE